MKKAIILVLAALVIPTSVALASRPANPGKAAPTVAYKFKGTLSGYTAYDANTQTNGAITILVKKANHHGKTLVGQTLTFPVNANTKVVFSDGVTAITDGDRGAVRIRAAKHIAPADLAATLQQSPAIKIKDHGAPTP